jgi:hypothetical protein
VAVEEEGLEVEEEVVVELVMAAAGRRPAYRR